MRAWMVVLLIGAFAATAAAQEPSFADVPEAVKALGSESFLVREKASAFLFAAGRAAEPTLENVQHSTDAEVASRARDILAKFQWGIYRDTPKEIVEQIEKFKVAATIKEKLGIFNRILDQRPYGARTAACLVTQPNTSKDGLLMGWLHGAVLAEVPDLLWRKDLDALELLLEAFLVLKTDDSRRNYVAFLLLRGRVQQEIPRWRARAELPKGEEAAALLTYLYRFTGDAKNLRWAAEKSNDPKVIEAVLHEQGAWAELAARNPKIIDNRDALGLQASYHRLAGQTKEFEDVVAAIVKATHAKPEGDTTLQWWYATPLLFNNRTKEAIEVLAHGHNYAFAYEILCYQTRYREAFQFADKLRGNPKADLRLAKARTLHELGEDEQAHKIVKEYACSWNARLKEDRPKSKPARYDDFTELPSTEYKLGLHDDALAHAAQLIQQFPDDAGHIVGHVFHTDSHPIPWGIWPTWWRMLRAQDGVAVSLGRMHALRQKRLPAADLEAIIRAGIPWLTSAKQQGDLVYLAATCQFMHRKDLARLCLEKLGEEKEQWVNLGQFLLKKEQWAEAAAVFAKACAKQKDAPEAYYLRGWALVKAGQEKEGRRWMELAHWLPLGREQGRYTLAGAMSEHGLHDEAARQWAFTCQLGNDDDFMVSIAQRRTASQSGRERQYEKAVDFGNRAHLRILFGGVFFNSRNWIAQPHSILIARAQGDIQAGKYDAARRTIQTATELMPGNVDLPLACVPALERKGRHADADELFERFRGHYGKLCKEYPRSSEFHNQLAWLTVRCNRQLDEALEHARQAVKLAPKNAGYLDTLAEVHFQRGEQKLAVDTITRATALEPHSAYLRKQGQRITTGNRAAPVPEN